MWRASVNVCVNTASLPRAYIQKQKNKPQQRRRASTRAGCLNITIPCFPSFQRAAASAYGERRESARARERERDDTLFPLIPASSCVCARPSCVCCVCRFRDRDRDRDRNRDGDRYVWCRNKGEQDNGRQRVLCATRDCRFQRAPAPPKEHSILHTYFSRPALTRLRTRL